MEVRVQIADPAEFEALLARFDGYPAMRRKALSSSINRALTSGRTIVRRRIQDELNIKTQAVQRTIAIRHASEAAPFGSLVISRKPQPLMAYRPTQTQHGVKVTVRKGKGAEVLAHAFIATLASGHVGVFTRFGPYVVPSKGRYSGKIARRGPRKGQPILRQQIKELYGPTVVGVIAGKPGLVDDIAAAIGRILVERLQSQISRFFGTA